MHTQSLVISSQLDSFTLRTLLELSSGRLQCCHRSWKHTSLSTRLSLAMAASFHGFLPTKRTYVLQLTGKTACLHLTTGELRRSRLLCVLIWLYSELLWAVYAAVQVLRQTKAAEYVQLADSWQKWLDYTKINALRVWHLSPSLSCIY